VIGKKAAKDKKGWKVGEDDIAKAMDRMANARLETNKDRKLARSLGPRPRRGGWHSRRG
jgi:hypothetical protein